MGLVNNLKEADILVLNIDDEKVKNLKKEAICKVITCSTIDETSDYFAKNINLSNEYPTYDLYYNGKFIGEVNYPCLENTIYIIHYAP